MLSHLPDHITRIIIPHFNRLWSQEPDNSIPKFVHKLLNANLDGEVFEIFQKYLGNMDDLLNAFGDKTNRKFKESLIDSLSSAQGLTPIQRMKVKDIFLGRNTFESV